MAIAALPSQRSLGLVCDYFRLLPSDPRLWAMTQEQMEDLYLQLAHLHPKEEQDVLRDPDFEREQEAQAEATRDVLWEDARIVPFGQAPPPAVPAAPAEWEEMTEWDYRQLNQQLG